MIHLDTNIVIAFLNGDAHVAQKIKNHVPNVAISSLVWGELLYGARASAQKVRNLQKLNQFVRAVKVLPYDEHCTDAYSLIRLSLRQKGRPTSEVDALIAAVAIAHKATLITNNLKHFQYIDNLSLEDWL